MLNANEIPDKVATKLHIYLVLNDTAEFVLILPDFQCLELNVLYHAAVQILNAH